MPDPASSTPPTKSPQPTKSPGSPLPWLLVAGLAFLLLVGTVAGSFIYAAREVNRSATPLELNASTCRPAGEWSTQPTVFLRKGADASPGDVMLNLVAVSPEGHVLEMASKTNTEIDIPSGVFKSVATVDLAAFGTDEEICFEISGLDDRLEKGDILVVGDFASPIVASALSSCVVAIVAAIVIAVSLIKARRRFGVA